MTNLEMFYFVGRCLSIDEHPDFRDVIVRKISDDEIEWAQFVSLCSNHLILPVIYLKFKAHKLIKYLPVELAEFLKEIYDLNLVRNEQILLQIKDILKLLNTNDIYPTFLKGTGNLLDGLYSDKGERMIGDIDFLVPEKDYLKAARILEADGYARGYPFFGNVLNEKHYPPIIKQEVPVYVEIHRLIVHSKYGSRFNPDLIKKKEISIHGENGNFVLCDKDKVIHNFIHSHLANKGNFKGLMSFRDIYDLSLTLKRMEQNDIINFIPFRSKAISYFVFASKALDLPQRFFHEETCASKILMFKHELNHNSRIFNKTFKNLIQIWDTLVKGYINQFIQAVYCRDARQFLVSRLSKRQWYKDHFRKLGNSFR